MNNENLGATFMEVMALKLVFISTSIQNITQCLQHEYILLYFRMSVFEEDIDEDCDEILEYVSDKIRYCTVMETGLDITYL